MGTRHKPLAPLSADELVDLLENNPSRKGLEQILRFDLPQPGDSNVGAPVESAVSVLAVTSDAVALSAPGLGTPDSGAPEVQALDFSAPEFIFRPVRPRLREAVTAQDGHTHGEQALYATLWRLARPAPGRTGLRALTVGERTLAAEVPMAYSTCQQNLRSLITKLALEVRAGGPNRSKTYLVYSFDEILRRRRAAGLTHVVRRTSGVTLVNPAACSGALSSGALDQGDPGETSGAPAADAPPLPSGAPALRNSGAPGFNAHIRSQESSSGTSTEDEASAALVQALREGMGTTDDDAVRRIFADSRAKAPDATVGEVAHFIRVQAARIGRLRGIENPMGLLIRQVPRCFEGESFRQFREAERQRREAERRQAEEVRLEAEQLLRDPRTPEADRQWARMLLEENQK